MTGSGTKVQAPWGYPDEPEGDTRVINDGSALHTTGWTVRPARSLAIVMERGVRWR